FVTVAREQSFTRAAVKLGVSQSALSQTVRGLEERLGLRLLTRTTRRVSPTAAGERLLQTAGPRFDEIQSELSALSDMRDKPAGTVRITAGEHAAISVLAPALDKILPNYPDINVEITVDYGLTDIVAERYDAGVRLGEQLAKDMIAVKIAPEMRMAVVGAPSYFRQNPWPEVPEDLTAHNCIQIRMPTYGNILFWEFEKDGHELKVRVEGQLVFNNIAMRLDAAKRGLGLAYMPEDIVAEDIAKGTLIRVLEDWCAPFSGYHLYYPNRRHASPAFALVVDALRYRG
ncbi:MAG: LysR family transcriptional regulator, partial [Rhizobium oryzihabitans]